MNKSRCVDKLVKSKSKRVKTEVKKSYRRIILDEPYVKHERCRRKNVSNGENFYQIDSGCKDKDKEANVTNPSRRITFSVERTGPQITAVVAPSHLQIPTITMAVIQNPSQPPTIRVSFPDRVEGMGPPIIASVPASHLEIPATIFNITVVEEAPQPPAHQP